MRPGEQRLNKPPGAAKLPGVDHHRRCWCTTRRNPTGADVAPTITCTNSEFLLVVGPDGICGMVSPRAAEVLQGFPPDYTASAGLTDSQRLRAMGNAVPLAFSAHLAERYSACLSRQPRRFRWMPEDVRLTRFLVETGALPARCARSDHGAS